ncbi:hypothetical protein AG4045_000769 [Apium graveolens]|uniref:Uncharacterized protein n=1 Tax=Apium graveolens TaxID=4045 RepID=A0A6L5B8P5_APIGR|nr:hypothetical protein AG4045_000769 [Apium graveolens]
MADNMYSSDGASGQAQTGEQVRTMAHGAADVASGAVQGTISLAQGTAMGAANVASGASDIMRSTFGGGSNPSSAPDHSNKRS